VTPHFVLPEERLKALRAAVQALALGAERTEVIKAVGPPSREELVGRKKEADWKYRYLIYDVKIIGAHPGNVHDERVQLIFDREDRLVKINSNVDGITSRPHPPGQEERRP
jgi:hypothetical protein